MTSSLPPSWPTFALLLALSFPLGCKQSAPEPEPPHDHSAHLKAEPAAPEETEAAAGPRIETGTFALSVAPGSAGFSVGKPGEMQIRLEGRGDWHVNQEYPIRVKIDAGQSVSVEKAELVRADAKRFDEEQVEFLANLAPSVAGEHDVRCQVSFAMCTEENCIREKRTLAMVLKAD